jgi:hypothetical protein
MSITRGPGSGGLASHCHHPLDLLSRRDNGNTAPNTVSDDDENGWASFRDTSLDPYEALELLTLGERWSSGRRTSAS